MRALALFIVLCAVSGALSAPPVIPLSEYVCSVPNRVQVLFDGVASQCGNEFTNLAICSTPSKQKFSFAGAKPGALYTLAVADRDATTPSAPLNSPLRQGLWINIPADTIRTGFVPGAINFLPLNLTNGIVQLYNRGLCNPPVNSLCHRYYVFLYEQTPGVTPVPNYTVTDTANNHRNWDFTQFATNNQLTKVSTNLFQAKNPSQTPPIGPCLPDPISIPDEFSFSALSPAKSSCINF